MKNKLLSLIVAGACFLSVGCEPYKNNAVSASGLNKASVKIETDSDGLSVEQKNIKRRLLLDNTIGSIKHLYLLSSITGKPYFYATVQGKVTSGNKRLTPSQVANGTTTTTYNDGFSIVIAGLKLLTTEVMQDDGAYGSSQDYIYFWDQKDQYHQLMVGSCNCIIHVSDKPIDFTEQALLFEIAPQEKQVQKR